MTVPTYMSGMLFTQAHKAVRIRIYSMLEKYALNPTYWSILSSITHADGGIRPARIAEQLMVKPPLITMLANDLIEKGLINRMPHHTDKRAQLLVATAEGLRLATIIEAELNTEIMSLLKGLEPTEIKAFQKTLETIIHNSTDI